MNIYEEYDVLMGAYIALLNRYQERVAEDAAVDMENDLVEVPPPVAAVSGRQGWELQRDNRLNNPAWTDREFYQDIESFAVNRNAGWYVKPRNLADVEEHWKKIAWTNFGYLEVENW